MTERADVGVCVWLTGLSASGKTSVARALGRRLRERGVHVVALDGDVLRSGLCADLGFDAASRRENVRRAAHVAALLADSDSVPNPNTASTLNTVITCAFISPYHQDRAMAREIIGDERFIECYVSCPLIVCEARDPKALYQRARAGEVLEFTGVSAPYEVPVAPDVVVKTGEGATIESCAALVDEAVMARLDLLARASV